MNLILFEIAAAEPLEPCRESFLLHQVEEPLFGIDDTDPVSLAMGYRSWRVDRGVLIDGFVRDSGHLGQTEDDIAVFPAAIRNLDRTVLRDAPQQFDGEVYLAFVVHCYSVFLVHSTSFLPSTASASLRAFTLDSFATSSQKPAVSIMERDFASCWIFEIALFVVFVRPSIV